MAALKDKEGRKIEYLRLSVTERCDLRCGYCSAGTTANLPGRIPSKLELFRIMKIFSEIGIRKLRITGGEPLLRKDLPSILRYAASLDGISKLAITTNGTFLKKYIPVFLDVGLSTLNISIDSLVQSKYEMITKSDKLNTVLDGIELAIASAIPGIKLNVVVIGGINDDEVIDFAKLSYKWPVEVRFIEYMPTVSSSISWSEHPLVSVDTIKSKVMSELGNLYADKKEQWGGPAEIYKLAGSIGRLGFISSVSKHYCKECNRLRVTSDGSLLSCLFGKDRLNLKDLIRSGCSDSEIIKLIENHIAMKSAVRDLPVKGGFNESGVTMSNIGG